MRAEGDREPEYMTIQDAAHRLSLTAEAKTRAPKAKRATMPRSARKRRILEVSVSDETRARIDRLVEETGWTKSKLVEDALELYELERARARLYAKRLGFSDD